MDIFGIHLPTLAGAAGVFASIYGAFAKFDGVQSDENRKFTRDWLLGLKADDRQWSSSFKEIFASIFGAKHFSFKCFSRSAALSVALAACIWTYIAVTIDNPYADSSDLLRVVLFWILAVIIADYLSLWKTRFLLTRPSLLNGGVVAIAIILLDALATLILYTFIIAIVRASFLVTEVVPLLIGRDHGSLNKEDLEWFDRIIRMRVWQMNHLALLLYLAPLFTSAWLWAYLIVAYGMRTVNRLPPLLRVLSKVVDVQSHPVKSIGYVAGIASAVVIGLFSYL